MSIQTDHKVANKKPAALLLVGGLGTRLRSVISEKPKALAPIGDAPFLKLLLLELKSQGIRRIVMCTGHFAEQIEAEFGTGRGMGLDIAYSRELQPLGTAGAIKLAEKFVHDCSEFFVLNGDSFLEIDFDEFTSFHRAHGGAATIALRKVDDTARYGTVQTDAGQRILSFREKLGVKEPGLINGGIYLFNRNVLDELPQGAASLEKDVLPSLLASRVYGFEATGMFIDIGTPEDYTKAQSLLKSYTEREAASSRSDRVQRVSR